MVQLAVTGNMGCGKTTICEMLISQGIPVYFSDNRAKELMNQDQSLIQQYRNVLVRSLIAVVCLTENGYPNEFLRIPKH